MTHELKNLIEKTLEWQNNNKKNVLATVVKTEGSSYRRPGVRMIINDIGERYGAVSGGCVEKEVQIQAQSVLESGIPKIMAYDGRLRLGCEGIIFVLIEPIIYSIQFFACWIVPSPVLIVIIGSLPIYSHHFINSSVPTSLYSH